MYIFVPVTHAAKVVVKFFPVPLRWPRAPAPYLPLWLRLCHYEVAIWLSDNVLILGCMTIGLAGEPP